MKLISRNDILLVAVVFMAAWLIRGCFTKVSKPEQMIRNEERIKYLEQERVEDSVVWVKREAAIDSLLSLSMKRYDNSEQRKQPLIKKYEQIPVIVNDLDREQLRRAIANF